MKPCIEVKYLNLEWKNKKNRLENPSKIIESIFSVKIEVVNETVYFWEMQTYTKIENNKFGQLAIRFLNDTINYKPLIIDASGNQIPMKLIENINGNKWWIEDLIIKKGNKKIRWSELFNQAGNTKIIFGNIECRININAITFTTDELQYYLNDFKDNFWKLISKPNSFVTGSAQQNQIKLLNKKSLIFLNSFIKYASNIKSNPKKELREIQIQEDWKKIKPTAKTFQEIATKGMKKKLTSRGTTESLNLAENKYILFLVKRVYIIINKMIMVHRSDRKLFIKNQKVQKKRVDSFSSFKTINKEKVIYNLDNLQNKLVEEKSIIDTISLQDQFIREDCIRRVEIIGDLFKIIENSINSQGQIYTNTKLIKYIIKLETKQVDYDNKIQFFGKIKRLGDENWDKFPKNNWLSLQFDKQLFNYLESDQEYSITATHIYNKTPTKKGTMHKIFFNHITELELLANSTTRLAYKTLYITLTKKLNNKQEYQFFGKAKINLNDNWYDFKQKNYLILEFDSKYFNNKFRLKNIYKITGFIESSTKTKENGNIENKRLFKYIDSIEIISSSLENTIWREIEKINRLEQQNWEMEMSHDEIKKQEKERTTILKDLDNLEYQNNETVLQINKLNIISKKIKNLIKSFESLGIKENSQFPNSITFVQNPNYFNTKKLYKSINNLLGIDENIYSSVLIIDKIGLVDVPAIYEKWCLLKIINLLIEDYSFIPEKNWKENLINQVLNQKYNYKIEFYNQRLHRNITFWHELELPNGKRPDFILDVTSLKTDTKKRFIMDAKFKENWDISTLVKELYFKKDYAENNHNMVFVLHPDSSYKIKNLNNPQEWSEEVYYGESELYNFPQDGLPNHRFGDILLTPFNHNGYYLDNLKRLVAMFLQYGMEDNRNIFNTNDKMFDPITKEIPFCTLCGSDNLKIYRFNTLHNRGYGYNIECNECKHSMEYNYCSSCKNRIIKNGRYWTYHATKPIEIFNIKCPCCGDYLLEEVE